MTATTCPSLATWWVAARPRTLPASIAPVLVGTAASVEVGTWLTGGPGRGLRVAPFLLTLVVAVVLQIAVNFANDYFDGIGGIDTPDRAGPQRAVASGLVAPDQMRTAMLVSLALAGAAGLALAAIVGWELLLVGLAALLATVGYSGGPRPYASAGLGEVFVFVFFGVVATVGSAYVQDERLTWLALGAAIPMGLLATALLVVNNLRDIPTDRATGKATLAVRLGDGATRHLYVGLVAGSYLVLLAMAGATGGAWYLLPLLSVPLLWPGIRRVRDGATGADLIAALGHTARGQLVFAALFTVALMARGGGLT